MIQMMTGYLMVKLFNYLTDPTHNDTDGDGMPDGWEIKYGLNPLDPADAF